MACPCLPMRRHGAARGSPQGIVLIVADDIPRNTFGESALECVATLLWCQHG